MSDTPTVIEYAGDEFLTVTTPSGHTQTVDVKSGRRAAAGPLELFIAGRGVAPRRTLSRFSIKNANK